MCAEFVKGDTVCDVGTDHGYLAAELLLTGKCTRAIAADINEKPLASARATIEKHGLADKAQIVLSDGLKSICDLKMSMSEMTFPHMLARVMLTEQIYRAYTIIHGKNYHK